VSSALAARFRAIDEGTADDAEIAWWSTRFAPGGGTVLDVACGSGRLLVPLRCTGVSIQGVDADSDAIALCEARLAVAGLDATLYRQSPSALNLPARYGAAIIGEGALRRLGSREDAAAAFARVRAHLVGDAVLVVATAVPAYAHARYGATLVELREAALDDGTRIRARFEIDPVPETGEARVRTRYALRRGSAPIAEASATTREAWFDADALVEAVTAAGWRETTIEAAPREPDDGATRFALVAHG